MTDKLARIAGPVSVAGAATLFTVPPGSTWSVNSIIIANPGGVNAVVKLGINGTTDNLLFLPATSVLPGGFATLDSLVIFGGGDSMQALVTGAATITVGGLEQN